jgi:hypothetical protein
VKTHWALDPGAEEEVMADVCYGYTGFKLEARLRIFVRIRGGCTEHLSSSPVGEERERRRIAPGISSFHAQCIFKCHRTLVAR